jgi:GNAT superfamily N-acetyltransferase
MLKNEEKIIKLKNKNFDKEIFQKFYDLLIKNFQDENEVDEIETLISDLEIEASLENLDILNFYFIITKDDSVLGGAGLEYYTLSNTFILTYLVVDSNERKKGYAKLLINECMNQVNEEIIKRKNIEINFKHNSKAKKFEKYFQTDLQKIVKDIPVNFVVDMDKEDKKGYFDPVVRINMYEKMGFKKYENLEYILPPLTLEKGYVDLYLFYHKEYSRETEYLKYFLWEFWEFIFKFYNKNHEEDSIFKKLISQF